MDYLLGFKFSQDHLELFFSAIRGRGGFNNNPNVEHFRAAYTKLLIHNDIKEMRFHIGRKLTDSLHRKGLRQKCKHIKQLD